VTGGTSGTGGSGSAGGSGGTGGSGGEVPGAEGDLAARVIDALLREGYGGLAGRVADRAGEPALTLTGDRGLVLPLEPDGFLTDLRIARTPAGLPAVPLTLDDVEAVLAALGDPRDREGAVAFAAECRQALAAIRLRERHLPGVRDRLARARRAARAGGAAGAAPDAGVAPAAGTAGAPRTAPDAGSGSAGMLGYEALAAALDHPAYPTSASRLGFSAADSLRYAPEYAPEFTLRWVAVPRSRLNTAGRPDLRPPGWPTAAEVGLPDSLAATHDLMPVHPVTADRRLALAIAEADLGGPPGPGPGPGAVIAPGSWLRVTPTLSTRTVAVTGDPGTHLKLPLPTSTLGLLNRRLIQPGTLADGALVRDILATAAADDARPGGPLPGAPLGGLLLADEGTYAHAGHPALGYLLRRLPEGLDRCTVVPLAALLAPGLDAAPAARRPLVIEELAAQARDGDLPGLLSAYLSVLFDVHVRLFVGYGIALESHQQNTALVLGPPGRGDRPRLLVKDFDGALIHLARLTAALGPLAPGASAFADPRLVTDSDDALADVFITITVHLCAGALAFGLADRGVAPLPDLLALVRRELAAALDRHAGWPAAAVLRARVLDADRLPGKSMLTAGTLVAKARTGAGDINKFYGTNGPNYLTAGPLRSCA